MPCPETWFLFEVKKSKKQKKMIPFLLLSTSTLLLGTTWSLFVISKNAVYSTKYCIDWLRGNQTQEEQNKTHILQLEHRIAQLEKIIAEK